MSMSVNVLLPSRHRQIVKVTPNTSILQILEDVCQKRGISSNEHHLKHHRRILAPCDTVRFANLPNNAQLELVRHEIAVGEDTAAVGEKPESLVTICLQLASGERFLKDFDADITLWDILTYWTKNGKENVLDVADDSGRILQPVCIYMRKEITGESELKKTTLRSLGILSGRVIIRLIHRPPNVKVSQAFVECLDLRQPFFTCEEDWDVPSRTEQSNIAEDGEIWSDVPQATASYTSFKSSESTDNWHEHNEEKEEDPVLETINDIVQSMETDETSSTTVGIPKRSVENPAIEFDSQAAEKDDESTFEDNLPARLIYLDDKGSLLYDLDEIMTPIHDELPDQFFEVTLDDVRIMLGDLKRQRSDLEDIQLKTSAMREAELLMRLNKYPKTVIRVNFPDRLVLQGSFKAVDKVEKIIDFVRSFLVDRELKFVLYTTPPKQILDSEKRLFEVPLVPAAVVHFGCDTALDHYLTDDVMTKISSLSAVNKEILQHSNNSESQSQLGNVPRLIHDEAQTPPSTWPVPSTSGESSSTVQSTPQSSRHQPSKGAIPKWFSMGKK